MSVACKGAQACCSDLIYSSRLLHDFAKLLDNPLCVRYAFLGTFQAIIAPGFRGGILLEKIGEVSELAKGSLHIACQRCQIFLSMSEVGDKRVQGCRGTEAKTCDSSDRARLANPCHDDLLLISC